MNIEVEQSEVQTEPADDAELEKVISEAEARYASAAAEAAAAADDVAEPAPGTNEAGVGSASGGSDTAAVLNKAAQEAATRAAQEGMLNKAAAAGRAHAQAAASAAGTGAPAPAAAAASDGASAPGKKTEKPPTSLTHRKEYMQFCRQCSNRKKVPHELLDELRTNRLDMFQMWMEEDKNMHAVNLRVKRILSIRNRSKKTLKYMKERDLPYAKGKCEALVAKAIRNGTWMWDPNFPGDEEEREYLVHESTLVEVEHEQCEQQEVEATVTGADDAELLRATLAENAPLSQAIAEPSECIAALSTSAEKKPKATPKAKAAAQQKPEGPLAQANLRMASLLKEAGEATNWSVALAPYKDCHVTCQQMKEHGQYMWHLYREIQKLVVLKVDMAVTYADIFMNADRASEWYRGRTRFAKMILKEATGEKKPAAKAKGKAKAKASAA